MDDISQNIDEPLWQAYLATTYEVKHLGLQIKIGQPNWHLEEFLVDNNVFTWAFISAYNPFSNPLSKEENEARHLLLINELEKLNLRYSEGFGVPANDDWEAEKSLLVLGISKSKAKGIAKQFEQNAFVFGRLGGVAELVGAGST